MSAAAAVRLYELADERDVLSAWLEETGGELTPEIEQLLDELQGQIEEKIQRVALYVREQTVTADAIEGEIKRLGALVAVHRRAADSLKAYLKRNLERLGRTKIEGQLITVAIQRNAAPAVTTVLEPEELYALEPARPFIRRAEVVQYRIDREALLALWKLNPASVPPMFTVELGTHIRLR